MGQFYLQYEYVMAATQLVLAMLGIGLTLTVEDFRKIFLYPRSLMIGLGIQMMLAPLCAWLALMYSSIPLAVATGLILCATAPGGSASNVFTHVAGGNTGLSVSLTAITSVACIFSMPFLLEYMISGGSDIDLDVPVTRIGIEIGGFLLSPLIAGMVFLRLFPKHAAFVSKWCIRSSLSVIALMIVSALSSGRMDIKLFGAENVMIVISFMIVHISLGIFLAKAMQVDNRDVTAIAIETAVRNGSLALMVKASLFPSGSVSGVDYVLFTVLLYTGMQSLFALVLIAMGRRINLSVGQAAVLAR